MRPFVFIASLFALTAALLLLVADSAGPCESMEEARADYHYVVTCDGEEAASGSVSFSNAEYSFSFVVEEAVEPDEGGEEAEPPASVDFVIARTTGDYSECKPAQGVGVFEMAMAEAEMTRDFSQLVFSCQIFPQAESVECENGPVLWPNPDGTMPEREGEQDTSCALVLTQAPAPADQ